MVVELRAKHNVKLVAVAAGLPRSKLVDAPGTRKVYGVMLVRVRCRTFPLSSSACTSHSGHRNSFSTRKIAG